MSLAPAVESVAEPAECAGLYVHIPFCSAVCPYCDFAVQTGSAAQRAALVSLLRAETALWGPWERPFDTVYFGGGTPSLLDAGQLDQALAAIRSGLPIRSDARLFLEANPEDVTPERIGEWRSLGVSFLSLGVQSFHDGELRALGRRHDGRAARGAVDACLEGGFDTVSVDLMFGLPDQDLATWSENLETVIALGPEHVSCYQLTIHEGTAYGRRRARGRLTEMPESAQADFFAYTHARLADAGWTGYEVSNFARASGHRSRHNLKYWRHVPYLGLGPSAHSFDGARRWWNHRALDDYARRIARGERAIEAGESLDGEALALEALMFGLRTAEGIDLSGYRLRYGVDLSGLNRRLIATLVEDGLVRCDSSALRPTRRGLAVADGLAARFRLAGGAVRPRREGGSRPSERTACRETSTNGEISMENRPGESQNDPSVSTQMRRDGA